MAVIGEKMEKINDIERGYLSRWLRDTNDLFRRNQTANATAIAAILLVILVIPPWPLLNDFTGALLFTLLMSLARGIDKGFAAGQRTVRAMLPVGLKMAVFLALFDAIWGFVTSGKDIFSDYASGGDWLANALLTVHGSTLEIIKLLLNGSSIATFEFQSPVIILLVFLGAARSIHPSIGLGYMTVAISAFIAILRNLAPTVLILIAGEFVIRAGTVMATAIAEHYDQTIMFAAAVGYATLIWVLSLVLYQFLRELVDGESSNSTRREGVKVRVAKRELAH